eukprot:1801471-Alexandrium_andersonii.AAC.1
MRQYRECRVEYEEHRPHEEGEEAIQWAPLDDETAEVAASSDSAAEAWGYTKLTKKTQSELHKEPNN